MPVVSVISSPSSTTAEFTLISPVRPSMMPSALKSTTVLFAAASCCCKVVMDAWRGWRPPVCLLSNSGMAEASDARVRKAREDVEPNMVNYFDSSLSYSSSMAGPILDVCQELQADCYEIVSRSVVTSEWTTDDERMGRNTMATQRIVQGEADHFMSTRTPSG